MEPEPIPDANDDDPGPAVNVYGLPTFFGAPYVGRELPLSWPQFVAEAWWVSRVLRGFWVEGTGTLLRTLLSPLQHL